MAPEVLVSGALLLSPYSPHPMSEPLVPPQHFFTVDVEEYFQVSAFDGVVSRDAWPTMPSRLDHSVHVLLELLDRYDVIGTFFTLGWIADHHPHVVRAISEAGHEVASHGYWHERVLTLTPDRFREDVRSAKTALEQLTGREVLGYRAPSFSIVPGCEWALDVLLEAGYRYDSSLFPVKRKGYGYPAALPYPHALRRTSGTLYEYPPATLALFGERLPAAGGGYLRHFPLRVLRRAFRDATRRGVPATFYVHPWEADPDQPRLDASLLTRIRHYRGLERVQARMEMLLREFAFTSIASHLPAAASADTMTGAMSGTGSAA